MSRGCMFYVFMICAIIGSSVGAITTHIVFKIYYKNLNERKKKENV